MPKVNIKLKSKKEVASDTMTFHFSKPVEFTFKPSQFADYTLIKPSETDLEGGYQRLHTKFFFFMLIKHLKMPLIWTS